MKSKVPKKSRLQRFLKQNREEIKQMEQQGAPEEAKAPSKTKELATAIFGLLVISLAILGIVLGTLTITRHFSDKKAAKHAAETAYYEQFIAPVVYFDAGGFATTDTANNLSLLIPAYFKAQQLAYTGTEEGATVTGTDILSDTAVNRYPIPAATVQEAAQQLFGQNVICQSFVLDGITFEYVPEDRVFLAPITVQIAMYTPNITLVEHKENGVTLTVEYVELLAPLKPSGKTMKMELRGEYQKEVITSIEFVEQN